LTKQNRVYELARQYKISSQAMIDVLRNLDFEIKSHMSPVNEDMLEAVENYFEGQRAEAKAEEARKQEVAEKAKAIKEAGKVAAKAKKESEAAAAEVAEEGEKHPRVRAADDKVKLAEKLTRARSEEERLRRQAEETKRKAEEKLAAPVEEKGEEEEAVEVAEKEPEAVPVEAAEQPEEAAAPVAEEAEEITEAAEAVSGEEAVGEAEEVEAEVEAEAEVAEGEEALTAGRLTGASLRERIRQSKEARETEGTGPRIIEKRAPQVKQRRSAARPAAEIQPQRKKKKKRKKGRREVDQEEVRSTIKETLADIRSGRSRPAKKRRRESGEAEVVEGEEERMVIQVTEFASVSELASQMDVGANDIIAACFRLGLMVTINQRLDMETIEFIADEFGYEVESIEEYGADYFEEVVEEEEGEAVYRAPVVTVMGHVDHGKTSLLDYIRRTKVVAGEVGGITQHIGAYEVETEGGNVTFLDTPGHEAFTAMRARGATMTDLVVLVVAADDKVMPQTVEAINHARAAGVPIIVAINKIDLPDADPDGVKQQLTQYNIVVEDFGGETVAVPVSAKSGEGIDRLIEMILLQSELLELTAVRTGLARGVVLESELDRGRGPVATVLIQKGVLEEGDPFLAGQYSGRARALFDPRGKPRRDAHPSQAVQILGFDGLPQPGDTFYTLADEKEARALSQKRQQIRREQEFAVRDSTALSDVRKKIEEGEIEALPLIVKGDTDGSVEALGDSLMKLSTDEVQVRVIHKGVGAINETDVMLAQASDAIIVGFHVRPARAAREAAEQAAIEIRTYDIIYEAVEDIRQGLEGLLKPLIEENVTGTLEVRDTFRVPRAGTIAGCMVVEGLIERKSRVRLVREGVVVYEGRVGSLKRFKDDVKEVKEGYECGVGLENFNDVKVGDVIEVYEREEIARTL